MDKSGWISPIVMKNTDRNNILTRVLDSKSDSVCGNTSALMLSMNGHSKDN
jgi:hypothetical protein